MGRTALERWFAQAKEGKSEDECWVVPPLPGGSRRMVVYCGNDTYVYRHVIRLLGCDIPSGMMVCHTCDNGHCCNPSHLFLGTQYDNMRDASNKGKLYVDKDLSNVHKNSGARKFTEAQVLEIHNSEQSSRALAKHYGVSRSCIMDIRQERSWKYLWEE